VRAQFLAALHTFEEPIMRSIGGVRHLEFAS
jgi:hypothetical protein